MLDAIDRMIGWVARAALALCVAMVLGGGLVVCYGVFMRYVLNQPVTWSDELVGYLLVYMVMLGAAETIRRGDLISVDLVSERFGPRGRRAVEIVGMAAVFAVGLVLLKTGLDMLAFSARINLRSQGYLAIELVYTQAALPIGGALIALTGLNRFVRALAGRALPATGGH